jgi:hypothetical protein
LSPSHDCEQPLLQYLRLAAVWLFVPLPLLLLLLLPPPPRLEELLLLLLLLLWEVPLVESVRSPPPPSPPPPPPRQPQKVSGSQTSSATRMHGVRCQHRFACANTLARGVRCRDGQNPHTTPKKGVTRK